MMQDITQFTADNTVSTSNGSSIVGSENVISLSEHRRQSAAYAPDSKNFIVLTEPRQTLISRKWGAAPKGTLILGCFTRRMSQEEILARYPFLTGNSRSLVGPCKLFGRDAELTCQFDHRGGLTKLLITVACADAYEAVDAEQNTLAHLWESELFPADTLCFNSVFALIIKGNIRVFISSLSGDSRVHLEITAVQPKGCWTEVLSNVISFQQEII
jgi:hypothetical protein